MKKFLSLSSFFLIITLAFIIQNCKEEPSSPENQAPQIQSLTSNPNTNSYSKLPAGNTATILVTATDPDKDPLTYTWECSGGSFTEGQNTNSVKWQSPITQNAATYQITVIVSDGALVTKKTINIYVEKAAAGINAYPTSLNFNTNIDTLQLKIFNIGTGTLKWKIQDFPSWATANLTSGTITQTSDTSKVDIIVKRSSLSVGQYNKTISVVNSDKTTEKVNVVLTMEIIAYGYVEGYAQYSGTTIPVSGVTISVENKVYTTSANGYYKLENLNTGTKTLSATKDGYDKFQTNINIIAGKNNKNVSMTSALYTHNLYGTVKLASSQESLQNVKVTVLNDDGTESQLQTTTDFSGYYQVPTVPQGQRKIKFQKQNYQIISPQIFMSNSDYKYDTQLLNKPGIPYNPTPADNEGNQQLDLTFTWSCVDPDGDQIKYDVYFGSTNYNLQLISQNQSLTNLDITDLAYNTDYFWQVIAKDNYGNISSSPVWKFTTRVSPCPEPTITYEGKTYNTVVIGEQCWLKKNLNVGTMIVNNSSGYLQTDNGIIEKYCYDNNPANCDQYGGLYEWPEAMQYVTTEKAKGICPNGWHIPTYAEFETLHTYVNDEAAKLVDESQTTSGYTATNETGFSALFAGYRGYNGYFGGLGNYTFFWSSTENGSNNAINMYLYNYNSSIYLINYIRGSGFSVRCLKD